MDTDNQRDMAINMSIEGTTNHSIRMLMSELNALTNRLLKAVQEHNDRLTALEFKVKFNGEIHASPEVVAPSELSPVTQDQSQRQATTINERVIDKRRTSMFQAYSQLPVKPQK